MPTFHLTAIPKAGCEPDLTTCPMLPRDIEAESEADALDQAQSFIDWEIGDYAEKTAMMDGDEAAEIVIVRGMQWQPVACVVDRPPIDYTAKSRAIEHWRDGQLVGTTFDFGVAREEQSFDVLVGGVVCGRLDQQKSDGRAVIAPVLLLAEGSGPLTGFVGRSWVELAEAEEARRMMMPEAALAGIRAALEGRG